MFEEIDHNEMSLSVDLTFRHEKIGGHSVRVLKSALQKAIRRKDIDTGLMVLYILDNVKDSMGSRAKSIRTNVMNRLIVCMSEEINIHELGLPSIMQKIHVQWQKSRKSAEWFDMFENLIKSRKCRLISDIKTYYNLPPYKMDLAKLSKIHCQLLTNNEIKPDNLIYSEHEFEKLCNDKNEKAFVAIKYLLDKKDVSAGTLWKIINKHADQRIKTDIQALNYFYKTMSHAEKPIYMYHALLLIIHAGDPRLDYATVHDVIAEKDLIRASENAKTFTGPFADHVMDVHTDQNTSKKTVVDFAIQGAFIVDEDQRFKDQKKRDMYIQFKELQVNVA